MNYIFDEEYFSDDLVKELCFLTKLSWKEAACAPDSNYDPDWEKYTQLNEMNLLRLFTVRQDGSLVGYITFIVSPTLHSKNTIHALHDSMFILKLNRKNGTAKDLISYAEGKLKLDGVHTMVMTVMIHRDFSVTLKNLGFKQSESSFLKRIG